MSDSIQQRMALALSVIDDHPDVSRGLASEILLENPHYEEALYLCAMCEARAHRFGSAIALYERCIKLNPRRAESWSNMGMCLHECQRPSEAKEYFKKALALSPTPNFMANLASAYIAEGNQQEAIKWANKALAIEKDHSGAWQTLGFANLGLGKWKEGWAGYEHCLGGRWRKIEKIGDERKWGGEPVESLFVYGEQGLGDEIMYASILPDAIPRAKHLVLECDKRLKGLFQRSFPTIEVRGTRKEDRNWAEGREFDAGCAAGSLATIFRPSRDECPKTPYLKADSERRIQWRALFDSWKKPVIGIAWTGGRQNTGEKIRNVGLESFRVLIENTDAVFVSLQYVDPTDEIQGTGLPVKHIHRAVQSPDYDDTAAFVAELDEIIGPPTTIHHLAGALGKSSTILVPSHPMWDCATGDSWAWYQDQRFFRQLKGESWADCIGRLHAQRVHRLRPAPADRLQRPPAFDRYQQLSPGIDYPADTVAVAHQA